MLHMDGRGTRSENRHIESQAGGLSQAAIEAIAGGIVVVAPDGTIALVNRRVEELSGSSRTELIGRSVSVLLPRGLDSAEATARDGSRFPIDLRWNAVETPQGRFVVATFVPASGQPDEAAAAPAPDRHLDFERLVAELSIELINLPSSAVDDAIRTALRRIGEELDLDRCSFFRIDESGILSNPVGWEKPGIPPVPAPTAGAERFPWGLQTVLAGEPV